MCEQSEHAGEVSRGNPVRISEMSHLKGGSTGTMHVFEGQSIRGSEIGIEMEELDDISYRRSQLVISVITVGCDQDVALSMYLL